MKKTISIIGSVGVPARYGGFETLCEQLCLYLKSKYNIVVYCSSKAYETTERTQNWKGITRLFISIKANGLSSIPYDIISLLKAGKKSDIILILGGSATFFLPVIKFLYPNLKIIFNPDGLEWKREKWNVAAKLFLRASIKIGCFSAHKIILDNKMLEKHYPKSRNKIHTITYGGDQHQFKSNHQYKYWLTIARAEKENNLELIANAFQKTKTEKWILLTNWEENRFGKKLQQKYGHDNNIEILNANYEKQKIEELISHSKGIIHGHSIGGTNPALVSAIWSKKRVLCHDNEFNRETTQNNAEYFSQSDELEQLINDNNKSFNSEQLKKLASEKYTWEAISSSYDKIFYSISR